MAFELTEFSNALVQATDKAAASMVAVHTGAHGSSSGVVWRPGVIVTADHALRRDEEIHVTLPSGQVAQAKLAGRDPATDIAVLSCPEAATAVADFGDAAALKAGSLTLVIGRTRASGPVAALRMVSLAAGERRTWGGAVLAPYVRLDFGVEPTATGGAVLDASGRIVGIASARFARFGAIAIPAAAIHAVVETLLKRGSMPQPYLGVGLQPIRLPDAFRDAARSEQKTGVIVLEVEPDGPANKAGIVIGDILISLAGHTVTRLEDVQAQLRSEATGKPLTAKLIRGGAIQEVTVTVGERSHGDK
jgi:S1-C subfamily serine protease